jgi:hypothetical protein
MVQLVQDQTQRNFGYIAPDPKPKHCVPGARNMLFGALAAKSLPGALGECTVPCTGCYEFARCIKCICCAIYWLLRAWQMHGVYMLCHVMAATTSSGAMGECSVQCTGCYELVRCRGEWVVSGNGYYELARGRG